MLLHEDQVRIVLSFICIRRNLLNSSNCKVEFADYYLFVLDANFIFNSNETFIISFFSENSFFFIM